MKYREIFGASGLVGQTKRKGGSDRGRNKGFELTTFDLPVADNTMAKRGESRSEMADARQSDGINVIFDQNTPCSSHSVSRSRSRSRSSSGSSSHGSGHYRGRQSHRGRYSSSSSSSSSTSSSSSRSSSCSRSRSHPRCRRRSSRCRCDNHHTYSGRSHHHRSPPRRYRAHSRSYSRSPSRHRYSDRRHYRSRSRSRSRSSGHGSRQSRRVSRFRYRFSRSPVRTYRYRSRSRSSGRSVSLSVDEKRELLKAAKANAMKILGVEKLELPESVKPILSEQPESKWESGERGNVAENDVSSSKVSPKRTISFSPNNSVAKPTMAVSSGAKVTSRVDSYESRMPYGHWIPIKPVQTSSTH
ncbi:hypothetical protein Q5P01_020512 [Channa striata]|uniref:Arginine/serine-rich protein 1 n=1 Tax=Channa striata TaxID=64152 RepID=A0AA88S261_CHASR|nr:hypothetical protein Q5P01_020512 [Channa striata]